MSNFKAIIDFRYACKRYSEKEVTKEDLQTILKAGILAPSSCGIEQFHFVALASTEAMSNISDICMKQGTARTANKAIIVLAAKKHIAGPSSERYNWHVQQRTEILNSILSEERQMTFEQVQERFDIFCDKEEEDFLKWSKANSYLAAMNIMNQAADLKIDSCPIEGFSQEKFNQYFPQFKDDYQVAMIITLGYRDETPPKRLRLPFSEMTTIL